MRTYLVSNSYVYGTLLVVSIFILISITDLSIMLKIRVRKNEVTNMKYILHWTSPDSAPFVDLGHGQSEFIRRNCPYTNCYVTGNKSYLGHYRNFDVIAFSAPEIFQYPKPLLPWAKSSHQKYVFVSIESSNIFPMEDESFDNFFNWTWTYKLNSDIAWGYIVIRDSNNTIVGPNETMRWIKADDMKPVTEDITGKLKKKSKAAAWFVSNCESMSDRENFIEDVLQELRLYGLTIDIYGNCDNLKCPWMNEYCSEIIERDYYFYFALENACSEDYVTEKLYHALKNYAVPVVYGGANYTRFMPDGIYLNAADLGAKRLAETMNDIIQNMTKYEQYFRWHNHYRYHRRFESIETDNYCNFCSILNNEKLVKNVSVYKDFRHWWNS